MKRKICVVQFKRKSVKIRERSQIISAAEVEGGNIENLIKDDERFRGRGEVELNIMSASVTILFFAISL